MGICHPMVFLLYLSATLSDFPASPLCFQTLHKHIPNHSLISSCSLQVFIAIPRKKQNKQRRKANFQTDSTLCLGFPKTDNLRKDIQTAFTYFLMSTSPFQTCYCRFPFLSMGENIFKGMILLTHFLRMNKPPHHSGLLLSTAVIEGLTNQL